MKIKHPHPKRREPKHGTGPGAFLGMMIDQIVAPPKKKPKK